jgi:hypothetical protein
VARAYRDKPVLSKLATTDEVDLNAFLDPCCPAIEAYILRRALPLHNSYCKSCMGDVPVFVAFCDMPNSTLVPRQSCSSQ